MVDVQRTMVFITGTLHVNNVLCLQEEFQNEIEHFLERRKPLIPKELFGPTGFGVFLQEQKKDWKQGARSLGREVKLQ